MIRISKSYQSSIIPTAIIMTLLCTTCLDPFPLPDVSIGLLVIEGTFTNEPEENQVILSYAGKVNETGVSVSGATVYISDNLGNTGEFLENEKGKYYPSSNDFRGIEGRKYVLHVALENGRRYQSDSCLFMDVPPIEELSWELKQGPSADNTSLLNGVEFYLDTYDPDDKVKYFLWKYDEKWQSTIPFPISDLYLGNNQFEKVKYISSCFLESRSREIMLESTTVLSESRIKDKPIIFISNETSRLATQYKLRVWQYGLSEEAYFYHEKLKEMTGQNGSIFDTQPFTLRGNIRNTEDPEEMVMGYFLVSGVSSRSISVGRYQLPLEYHGSNPIEYHCRSTDRVYPVGEYTDINRTIRRMESRSKLIFVGRVWEIDTITMEEELVGLQFALPECTSCDGSTERPEDWK